MGDTSGEGCMFRIGVFMALAFRFGAVSQVTEWPPFYPPLFCIPLRHCSSPIRLT